MGVTVRQKSKGKNEPWWCFIAFKNRRKSIKVGDKKEAQKLAVKIEARLKAGQLGIMEPEGLAAPTFEAMAQEWYSQTVLTTLSEATHRDYRVCLDKHILPKLGRFRVDEIKPLMVKDFIRNKLAEGYASSTVCHMRNAISGVMGRAVEAGLIQANPARQLGRGLIKVKDRKADVRPFTREELAKLLSVVQEKFLAYYPFVLFMARTGARIGEAVALEWGDIDHLGGYIMIQRSHGHRCSVKAPKSGKGRRVDMSRQLGEVLKALHTQRKRESLAKGRGGEIPARVFLTPEWRSIDQNHFRGRVWKKGLESAGLSYHRVHDVRHTFSSLLIQAGESLAYVRDLLGHHSISLTVDTYGHLVPGANRAAVDRLDDPAYFPHQSAPYPHPGQNERGLADAKPL